MDNIAKAKGKAKSKPKTKSKAPAKSKGKTKAPVKGIEKIYTEKERYALLKEAGYSTEEARKIRRQGLTKFLTALGKKSDQTYEKARTIYNKSPEEIRGKQLKFKIEKANYNYAKKYNYIIHSYYKAPKEDKPVIRYFTYSTNQKIPEAELYEEIQNYVITSDIKYGTDLIYWEIISLEIK